MLKDESRSKIEGRRSKILLLPLLLASVLAAMPSCGDAMDDSLLAFGNLGAVQVTGFDPAADPPQVVYLVRNYNNFLTYLRVEITVTVDGKEYTITDEPLGPRGAPIGKIKPGVTETFTIGSNSLPSSMGPGVIPYRVRARVNDFRAEAADPPGSS